MDALQLVLQRSPQTIYVQSVSQNGKTIKVLTGFVVVSVANGFVEFATKRAVILFTSVQTVQIMISTAIQLERYLKAFVFKII